MHRPRKNHSKRNVCSPPDVVSGVVLLVKIHQKTSMIKEVWIEPNEGYLVCLSWCVPLFVHAVRSHAIVDDDLFERSSRRSKENVTTTINADDVSDE